MIGLTYKTLQPAKTNFILTTTIADLTTSVSLLLYNNAD